MGRPDPAATTFAQYDPAQPWSVLQDSAFSRQLGWWAGSGSASTTLRSNIEAAYGTEASIWIESISQSAGLDTYLAIGKYGVNVDNTMTVDPAAHGYTGIFGTAGSSSMWQWDYQMDHNTYAVPWADLSPNQQYTATLQGLRRRRTRQRTRRRKRREHAGNLDVECAGADAGAGTHDLRADGGGSGPARMRDSPAQRHV